MLSWHSIHFSVSNLRKANESCADALKMYLDQVFEAFYAWEEVQTPERVS